MILNYHGQNPAPENIIDFIQAALEDPGLTQWLLRLEPLSLRHRQVCIARLMQQMHAAGEHPDVVQIVKSLQRPEVLDAVLATVRDAMLGS